MLCLQRDDSAYHPKCAAVHVVYNDKEHRAMTAFEITCSAVEHVRYVTWRLDTAIALHVC